MQDLGGCRILRHVVADVGCWGVFGFLSSVVDTHARTHTNANTYTQPGIICQCFCLTSSVVTR
jgi:hypothetical protein